MTGAIRKVLAPLAVRALLLREWWQSGVTYYPLSPRVRRDPYPHYARLRARDPVHWSALMNAWVVSRYADVDAILRDHRRFANDPRKCTRSRLLRTPLEAGEPSMLFLDPPDHTRLRSLVSKAFTPQAIAALEPRIRAIVNELLDGIADPAAFDLIEVLAYPLPVIVIAELLGVPPQDRAQFKRWSDQRARILEPVLTARERQEAMQAAKELDAYFLRILDARRREPRADLISALVAAEEQGDRLTQAELLVMLRLLLVAGNETTTNLIGNGMLALLRHPDQLHLLRARPELLPSAVEELLRYDAPVQIDARTAVEDVDLHGRHIAKGQAVILLLGAANRDPEVFPHPDTLDIIRQQASHIAFGRGIHHCLGAPLARLEARIAFEALLQRFADLRLLSEEPPWRDNVVLRGLRALPLRATVAR
ncbi:MAG: cytochrome P450 [Candidatus Tectimicrobiota bacterium]|nr:MAG: cytochrome P450 [Candidatus Tectomicrobia bacterium]